MPVFLLLLLMAAQQAFAQSSSWRVTPLPPVQTDAERVAELSVRREAVMRKIGPKSMLILYAAENHVYAADVSQPYREENNFYYLTGIEQSGPQTQSDQRHSQRPPPCG